MSNTVDTMINIDLGDFAKKFKQIEKPKIFDYQKGLLEKIAANCNIPVRLLKQPIPPMFSLSAIYVERMRREAIVAAKAGTELQKELFKHYLRKRRPDLYAMAYGFQAQNRELRGRESIKVNRRRIRLIRKVTGFKWML